MRSDCQHSLGISAANQSGREHLVGLGFLADGAALVLGTGLGAALGTALTHGGAATVPVSHLVVYILGTGAAGLLASVAPARRAARLDLLAALATE